LRTSASHGIAAAEPIELSLAGETDVRGGPWAWRWASHAVKMPFVGFLGDHTFWYLETARAKNSKKHSRTFVPRETLSVEASNNITDVFLF
jgi:hypothetical protein